MRRREFLGAMGAVASAWPIAAASQTAPPRIGVLFAGAEGSPESKATFAEISEGLRDVGLIEGRDYVLEWRFAAGGRGPFYDRLGNGRFLRSSEAIQTPFPGAASKRRVRFRER